MIVIYLATGIGGFTSVVAQSTWQSNTPVEGMPAGQGLYSFAITGGSCIFSAIVGVVMGTSGDYARAFAIGFIISAIGFVCANIGFKLSAEETV